MTGRHIGERYWRHANTPFPASFQRVFRSKATVAIQRSNSDSTPAGRDGKVPDGTESFPLWEIDNSNAYSGFQLGLGLDSEATLALYLKLAGSRRRFPLQEDLRSISMPKRTFPAQPTQARQDSRLPGPHEDSPRSGSRRAQPPPRTGPQARCRQLHGFPRLVSSRG